GHLNVVKNRRTEMSELIDAFGRQQKTPQTADRADAAILWAIFSTVCCGAFVVAVAREWWLIVKLVFWIPALVGGVIAYFASNDRFASTRARGLRYLYPGMTAVGVILLVARLVTLGDPSQLSGQVGTYQMTTCMMMNWYEPGWMVGEDRFVLHCS